MDLSRGEGRYSLEIYVVLVLLLVPETTYMENFENLLVELRGKEYMGMSEVPWPQKRNYMYLPKNVK